MDAGSTICSHRMRTYVGVDSKLRSQRRHKSVREVTFTPCRFSPHSGIHRIGQDGPEFPYRNLMKYRNLFSLPQIIFLSSKASTHVTGPSQPVHLLSVATSHG
jgi:hypothetical protein